MMGSARPTAEQQRLHGELMVEKVLRATELIPSGQVIGYGELGAIVGAGARQVGQIMARHGSAVPWWRVTNASGDLHPHVLAEARPHCRMEGIDVKPNGRGCRIETYRCDLDALASAWVAATADLGVQPAQ